MSAPLANGTVLAERFRIVRLLGAGTTGKVYEIVNQDTRQRAAMKVLEPRWAEELEAGDRFLRDASGAGRTGNAHIVSTSDAGRLPSGEPYVVMELLDGITLAQRIAETGGLALPELCEVMSQACDGVQAAHHAGIVHASLSPDSIFITSGGGRPLVKILDFGAAALGPSEPAIDALEDVYALGAILHEAAAGARASAADGPPAALASLRPELPAALGELVRRARARGEGDERPPSVRDLGQAIAALSPSTPIDPLGLTLPVESPPGVSGALTAAIAAEEASRAAAQARALQPAAAPAPSLPPPPPRSSRRLRTIAAIVAGAIAALLVALAASRLRGADPGPPPSPAPSGHRR